MLMALHELWPEASLYTAVYNPDTAAWAKDLTVRTSFLQNFPFAKGRHEWFAWATPWAFESFDFSDFEVVVSVTSAEAKYIVTPPQTLHICYCLTPTRYLWSGKKIYERQGILGLGLRLLGPRLRQADYLAAQKPDYLVAISQTVRARIKKYYNREAEMIYPPVDVDQFKFEKPAQSQEDYYLVVSRLVRYKRVDLAIRAFNRLGRKLVIVGTGEEEKKLKSLAKRNIVFAGQLTDKELVRYYRGCRAVIFPGEEDFGLVSIEAQALGKPVIAFNKGGVTETVISGKTGEFFKKPDYQSLAKVVKKLGSKTYKPKNCRDQALKFSKELFQVKFRKLVEAKWQQHRKAF